jgi:hypothetical protein
MNLDALIRFYHALSPESVARFPEFYSADAYFKDPFNEVRGVAPSSTSSPHVQTGRENRVSSSPKSRRCRRRHADLGRFHFRVAPGCGENAGHARRLAPEIRCRRQGQLPPRLLGRREELYMKLPVNSKRPHRFGDGVLRVTQEDVWKPWYVPNGTKLSLLRIRFIAQSLTLGVLSGLNLVPF